MTATEQIHERAHDEDGSDLPPTLYERVLRVVKAVGVVEKDQRNKFHNYSYSSIEGVVDALHEPLAEHGILVLGGVEDITDVSRATREGEAIVTTIRVRLSLVDVLTGERLDIPWAGRGDDPADKGVSKALTDARKTFLIQQFNLRRGDDTEADPSTDERHASNGRNVVNMTEHVNGSGLTNAVLNQILVAANLPAHEKPYGSFARIPADVAENVLRNLEAAKRAKT